MIYLISAPIFFAIALSFFKITTKTMHPLLGNVITGATAVFVALLILLYNRFKGVELFYTRDSLLLSLVGGVLYRAIHSISFLCVFKIWYFQNYTHCLCRSDIYFCNYRCFISKRKYKLVKHFRINYCFYWSFFVI